MNLVKNKKINKIKVIIMIYTRSLIKTITLNGKNIKRKSKCKLKNYD